MTRQAFRGRKTPAASNAPAVGVIGQKKAQSAYYEFPQLEEFRIIKFNFPTGILLCTLAALTSCSTAKSVNQVVFLDDGIRLITSGSTDLNHVNSFVSEKASTYCSRYDRYSQIDKTITTTSKDVIGSKYYSVDYYFRCYKMKLRPGRNCVETIKDVDFVVSETEIPKEAPVGQVITVQYSYTCRD